MTSATRSHPDFSASPLCRCVSPCDIDRPAEVTDSARGRWVALYVLCAGVLMIVLDTTIVNVATFSSQRTRRLLADGQAQAQALNTGYHLAYLISAVLVVLATAVAATALRPAPVGEPDVGAGKPATSA